MEEHSERQQLEKDCREGSKEEGQDGSDNSGKQYRESTAGGESHEVQLPRKKTGSDESRIRNGAEEGQQAPGDYTVPILRTRGFDTQSVGSDPIPQITDCELNAQKQYGLPNIVRNLFGKGRGATCTLMLDA